MAHWIELSVKSENLNEMISQLFNPDAARERYGTVARRTDVKPDLALREVCRRR